ncbi:hypothetical protein D1641_01260 [Colidextribacter sp. OB.20]|uniref:hypothetical protein n=1 Tax=Colidextribacter sp. OB.20 TaxID=2304568 RepID=UPI00136A92D3|nr:hypothetical protein [Colidextribacter sp. OB.20]NBI08648.1 hypothetical protein [Colidextribacter sp. OB.20]
MEWTIEYPMWAPFADENPEPDGALPNYGTPLSLGEVNKFQYAPTMNEGKAYGNSVLARYLSVFKEGTAQITLLDVENVVKSKVLGAELDEKDGLIFRVDDKPPYGGYGCIAGTLLAGNRQGYFGIFLPKLKAVIQGKELNTNGENIQLTSETLNLTYSAAKDGTHFMQSPYFDTKEEAMAWVDQRFVKASSSSVQSAPARTASKAGQV